MENNVLERLMGHEWCAVMEREFDKEYMKKLSSLVKERRKVNLVYPESNDVFNAYRTTTFSDVKVVILGMDPYINPKEAHGLAFSTMEGKSTPSLRKMAEAVERDVYNGLNLNWDNNLSRWAEQGVFLLNTILTVDAGKSLSHQGFGWEKFTRETIARLSDEKSNLVFLLWGKVAQQHKEVIDTSKHLILEAEHPVYASYQGRSWDNRDCFNKVNTHLQDLGYNRIIW